MSLHTGEMYVSCSLQRSRIGRLLRVSVCTALANLGCGSSGPPQPEHSASPTLSAVASPATSQIEVTTEGETPGSGTEAPDAAAAAPHGELGSDAAAVDTNCAGTTDTTVAVLARLWRENRASDLLCLAVDASVDRHVRRSAAAFLYDLERTQEQTFLDTYAATSRPLEYDLWAVKKEAEFLQECGPRAVGYAQWRERPSPCDSFAPLFTLQSLAETGHVHAAQVLLRESLAIPHENEWMWVFRDIDGPVQRLRDTQPRLLFELASQEPGGQRVPFGFVCECCGAPTRPLRDEAKRLSALSLEGRAAALRDRVVRTLLAFQDPQECEEP